MGVKLIVISRGMEGGFHIIFVTYISGLAAVAGKDFFSPTFLMFSMVCGFLFFMFFWNTKCHNMGKKCLRSYWHLRNSQKSDWYVSFRAKLIPRFWFKDVCKVKFTQTDWILQLTSAMGQSALDGIAWPVPLIPLLAKSSRFFYYCSVSGHQ